MSDQICSECGQSLPATKLKCTICGGDGKNKDGPGICQRCNGSGREISALNRANRSRGHANERRLAKTLQKWWSPDGKYEFKRAPQSGGSALKIGWGLAGDIVTTAPDFPFHIECKREKGWSIDQLVTAPSGGKICEYWKQAKTDCPTNKLPIVLMSHPTSPIQLVVAHKEIVSYLKITSIVWDYLAIFDVKQLLAIQPELIIAYFDTYLVPFG